MSEHLEEGGICELCSLEGVDTPATRESAHPWHEAFETTECRYVELCDGCWEEDLRSPQEDMWNAGEVDCPRCLEADLSEEREETAMTGNEETAGARSREIEVEGNWVGAWARTPDGDGKVAGLMRLATERETMFVASIVDAANGAVWTLDPVEAAEDLETAAWQREERRMEMAPDGTGSSGDDVLLKRMKRPDRLRDEAPDRLSPTDAEERVGGVVTSAAKRRVEEAVARWNAPLREAVRSASALRLRSETKRGGSVAVSVVDGMPAALADATGDLEQWEWWLVVHGPALQRAGEGLKIVADQKSVLEGHLGDVGEDLAAVERSRKFLERALSHSAQRTVEDRLAAIEDDVLGAYWVQEGKIQVYWMPVAIYASVCDVPIERMTMITLCHELGHAYTHLGLDLNRNAWDTDHFMDAENYIKEGLAQFYTEAVMRTLDATRAPGVLGQFLTLTEKQSAVYNDYQNWVSERGDAALEAVRYAMLEYRNAPTPGRYEEFVEAVQRSHAALGGPVTVEAPKKAEAAEESAQRRLL